MGHIIFTSSPNRIKPGGSTAYLVHHTRLGLLGAVGNHHTKRGQGTVTVRTSWWAEKLKDGHAVKPLDSRAEFRSRDTAAAWLSSTVYSAAEVVSAAEHFTVHIQHLAEVAGYETAWNAASNAVYLRLQTILETRYQPSPAALWTEIVTMISWLEATRKPKTASYGT